MLTGEAKFHEDCTDSDISPDGVIVLNAVALGFDMFFLSGERHCVSVQAPAKR